MVVPWVTLTETPASVADSGKTWPKIENTEPWAIWPLGEPGGAKLAGVHHSTAVDTGLGGQGAGSQQ